MVLKALDVWSKPCLVIFYFFHISFLWLCFCLAFLSKYKMPCLSLSPSSDLFLLAAKRLQVSYVAHAHNPVTAGPRHHCSVCHVACDPGSGGNSWWIQQYQPVWRTDVTDVQNDVTPFTIVRCIPVCVLLPPHVLHAYAPQILTCLQQCTLPRTQCTAQAWAALSTGSDSVFTGRVLPLRWFSFTPLSGCLPPPCCFSHPRLRPVWLITWLCATALSCSLLPGLSRPRLH